VHRILVRLQRRQRLQPRLRRRFAVLSGVQQLREQLQRDVRERLLVHLHQRTELRRDVRRLVHHRLQQHEHLRRDVRQVVQVHVHERQRLRADRRRPERRHVLLDRQL
jgi:hypothetical protein